MTRRELELTAFASRVRSCEESGACCRAAAAHVLGEPTVPCRECGHPTLPDAPCPCLQYVGEVPNPAAQRFHELSAKPEAAA